MFDDQGADFGQFVASETFRHCQVDRVQPVFSGFVAMFNVNVWRFRSFLTEEEKSETECG